MRTNTVSRSPSTTSILLHSHFPVAVTDDGNDEGQIPRTDVNSKTPAFVTTTATARTHNPHPPVCQP